MEKMMRVGSKTWISMSGDFIMAKMSSVHQNTEEDTFKALFLVV